MDNRILSILRDRRLISTKRTALKPPLSFIIKGADRFCGKISYEGYNNYVLNDCNSAYYLQYIRMELEEVGIFTDHSTMFTPEACYLYARYFQLEGYEDGNSNKS